MALTAVAARLLGVPSGTCACAVFAGHMVAAITASIATTPIAAANDTGQMRFLVLILI